MKPINKIDEIARLMVQSTQLYEHWAKQQGINYNTLAVFYSIVCYQPCTQKHISDGWGLPKQTVFSVCKQLSEKGYLYFEQDDQDKRGKTLHLSEQGKALAEPIVAKIRAVEQAVIAEFGEQETEQFIQQLQRFVQIIANKTQ